MNKVTKSHLASVRLGLLCAALSMALPAKAGNFFIQVDPGTTVDLNLVQGPPPGKSVPRTVTDGGPGDLDPKPGKVWIFVDPDIQKSLLYVTTHKIIQGKEVYSDPLPATPPVTFTSYEPFDLPSFIKMITGAPLVVVSELESLKNSGFVFHEGDVFDVTAGTISGVSGFTFRDGQNLPSDVGQALSDLQDPSYVATLPLFSGQVTVASIDHVLPVPEPTAMTMAALGLLLTLAIRLKARYQGSV
jgi:hypothetical protein